MLEPSWEYCDKGKVTNEMIIPLIDTYQENILVEVKSNYHYLIWINQEEECEIEVIEYTTTTTSKSQVQVESKAPIISGEVIEMGSRVKQSEVRLLDPEKWRLPLPLHGKLYCLSWKLSRALCFSLRSMNLFKNFGYYSAVLMYRSEISNEVHYVFLA